MSRTDDVLGVAPPHSLDSVMSGLVRLRRNFDVDEEEAQSRGITAMHPDRIRVALIDKVIAWLRPGVEAEAAEWNRQERAEQLARERRWPG